MTESADEQRLYCTPGAEECYFDPAAAYENQIEPWHEPADGDRREIEEWSVHPPEYHVPSADSIVDHLIDLIIDDGELGEGGCDQLVAAIRDADLLAAAEALRSTVASKLTYRMAHKCLRSMWVTWDEAGDPLLDGEPMYVKAAVTATAAASNDTDARPVPLTPDSPS